MEVTLLQIPVQIPIVPKNGKYPHSEVVICPTLLDWLADANRLHIKKLNLSSPLAL